jgi:hypothetical protein
MLKRATALVAGTIAGLVFVTTALAQMPASPWKHGAPFPEPEPQLTRFLDAVKTRKKFALNEQNGHRSCTLINLAKIAVQLGRSLNFDPIKLRLPRCVEGQHEEVPCHDMCIRTPFVVCIGRRSIDARRSAGEKERNPIRAIRNKADPLVSLRSQSRLLADGGFY